ncbi:MAG: HD domain-containing protein [Acidilobaceae archaeon]
MRPEFLGIYKPRAVIQDSIHGIIPINEAEYWILQTPFLRRLHEIKQLGLSYLVFPSATHSRLEHSLGVMHLASRMAYRVIEASRRSSKVCSALFEKCDDRVYSTFIQVARLAGLLHDLGHPPFSHMSEDTIEDLIFNPELRGLSDDSILGSLSEAKNAIIKLGEYTKIHEAYTKYFIESLIDMSRSIEYSNLSYLLELALESISPGRLKDIDVEVGIKLEACAVINKILSNNIVDVDRLDYLVRDAKYTGVIYGYIDIDRVLESLEVTVIESKPDISLPVKALPAIEDVFDARFKMYKSLYYHHKFTSIQLALDRAIVRIAVEWSNLEGKIFDNTVSNLGELLNPIRLSDLIREGIIYFDDIEVLSLIKILNLKGSSIGKRWAKPLLHERRLLPISLIKRSDEVIAEIKKRVGKRVENIGRVLEEVFHDNDVFSSIVERSIYRIIRSLSLNSSDIITERAPRRIVKEVLGPTSDIIETSTYLRMLVDIASTPIISTYLLSDYEDIHLKLYSYRETLRKSFIKELVEEVTSRIKS